MYFRRIKDMREDHDLTQEEVAQLLGIRQTVYSRYERGFQTIPLIHLIALANHYHVSLDYMTERTDNPNVHP